MQKALGIGCVIVGIYFLVWGHNISQSPGSQIQEVFTGEPSSKAVYLYLGGAAFEALGVFLIFFTKK